MKRFPYAILIFGLILGSAITLAIRGLLDERAVPDAPIIVYEEVEVSTLFDETLFLPMIFAGTQPCIDIENHVMIRYVDDFRVEGPFMVVDCAQHAEEWPTELQYEELVNVEGSVYLHFGIANQGEEWLNVLIWWGSEKPYSLNLILIETEE